MTGYIRSVPYQTNRASRLTKNFSIFELTCHDGTRVPRELYDNAKSICERAQLLRNVTGPLIVVSGYRTVVYNKQVGGATKSQHLTASALDLASRKFNPKQLVSFYLDAIEDGDVPDGGVGVYPSWIHIDLGRPRRWAGKEMP